MSRAQVVALPRAARDRVRENERIERALGSVSQGDRKALRDLYKLASHRLFALCLKVEPDRSSAEANLRDLYLAIWRDAGAWCRSHETGTEWLLRYSRRQVLEAQRTQAGDREARFVGLRKLVAGDEPLSIKEVFLAGATYAELAAASGRAVDDIRRSIRSGIVEDTFQGRSHQAESAVAPGAEAEALPKG